MSVIEYVPVCGLTIKEALKTARTMAREQNKKVIANINDVIMCISSDSDIQMSLDSYREKLDFKYEIENMKREKQK